MRTLNITVYEYKNEKARSTCTFKPIEGREADETHTIQIPDIIFQSFSRMHKEESMLALGLLRFKQKPEPVQARGAVGQSYADLVDEIMNQGE